MKPKARIKSGLIAAVLGLTATFNPVGSPFSLLGNSASAQQPGQFPVPAAVSPAADAYQISTQKLHFARKAVATKDLATAERLTAEVEQMNLAYRATDDRPEQVRNLIHQFKYLADFGRNTANSAQFRRSYAVFSLQQADTMLRRGELELATQLTQEASAQNADYNQSDVQTGLEPQTMLKRIDDARRVQNRNVAVSAVPVNQSLSQAAQQHLNQAVSILQQARAALNAGDLSRAEQLCRVAVNYNLAESVYPAGNDTPSRLLAEIASRRQALPGTGNAVPGSLPAPQNMQAVYHPVQNPAYNVQQVRDGGMPLVASNAPLIDQTMRDRQTLVSQISSDIMQQIADAQKISREQRNPDAGLDILQNAKIKVQQSQLDAATKDAFIRNIDRAIADTVKFNDQHQVQFDLAKQNQAVLDDRRREAEDFRNKEERLKTLFSECNKLIDEQRYEEAVLLAKKAREFAPDEPATHMLLTTTQLAWNAYRSTGVREDKANAFVDAMLGVDNSSVMPNFEKSPLHYIDNWKGLTSRRRSSDDVLKFRRAESELEILRKLEMPVSINLDRPIPLEQLLKILSGQTGVDIIVDWNALREVDVTTDRLVSIQIMKEIKFKSVLNLVLDQMNLAYVVKNEMLNITSSSRAKGEIYQNTYYIGDLLNSQSRFNGGGQNDFNGSLERAMRGQSGRAVSRGNSLSPLASNNPATDQNLVAAAQGNPSLMAQNFGSVGMGGTGQAGTPNALGGGNGYGMAQPGAAGGGSADFGEIMDLIEAVVSPESWQAGGGDGEMMEYYPTLSLVVRQTEEVHSEIVDLLAQLRKLNDLQIAVEVRFITLSDDFYEMMGMDFDLRFKNDGAAARVKTQYGTSDDNNNNDSGVNTVQVTGGNNVTVGMSAPGDFSVDLSIPFNQNSYGLVNPVYGGFQPDAGIQAGFALLSQIEAYFFMNATQGDSRSNVLQAPKVMVFNGQMGNIMDISQSPFVTSVVPVVGDFAAAYQPIIVILNEGQFTTVQATVSNNRQYVRLTLNPVFSKITKVSTFRYVGEDSQTDETETASKGNDKAAASTDERNATRRQSRSNSGVTIQLPTLATFSVMTTVSVPDGGTILLGGVKRLSEGRTEAGVPILNKIPYVQRLFSNTAIGRTTQSIMMMVTPRIIIQEEEEEYLTGNRTTP